MGKTVASLNHLGRSACEKPNGRFAFIEPTYRMAHRIVYDYVKQYFTAIPGTKFNESDLTCAFPNGSRLSLYGSDNPDSLRGLSLDGVVYDEYSQQPPNIHGEIIGPALVDRKGYAVWIGTIVGRNHLWRIYDEHKDDPDWFCMYSKASETGIIPQSELDIARKNMTEDEYNQEFELDPLAAIRGAIYGKELRWLRDNGRITTVPVEEYAPVDTGWDLGFADYTTVVFFQTVGLERHIIDCYATNNASLGDIVKVLEGKPYRYGTHYLPHDAKQHELQTGKTREDFLRNALRGNVQVVQRPKKKEDGIQLFRLYHRKFWIEAKCQNLIDALEQYQMDFDQTRGVFTGIPKHDWTSHICDSVQTICLAEKMRQDYTPVDYGTDEYEDVGGLMS